MEKSGREKRKSGDRASQKSTRKRRPGGERAVPPPIASTEDCTSCGDAILTQFESSYELQCGCVVCVECFSKAMARKGRRQEVVVRTMIAVSC